MKKTIAILIALMLMVSCVFDSGFLSALFATILGTAVNMALQLVIAFVLVSLLNIQKLKPRKIDGASDIQVVMKIVLPLAKPGIITQYH